jgi:hypothetical protein
MLPTFTNNKLSLCRYQFSGMRGSNPFCFANFSKKFRRTLVSFHNTKTKNIRKETKNECEIEPQKQKRTRKRKRK